MTSKHIFIAGLFVRIFFYTILIFFPFYHQEQGYFGSFILQNADFDDYLFVSRILILDNNPFELSCPSGSKCNLLPVTTFFENYLNLIKALFYSSEYNLKIQMIVGPIFPLIILLTNYSDSFPYILSLICFISEILALFFWLKYYEKNSNWYLSVIFAFFPFTIIFGLIHSPDIITYFLLSMLILNKLKIINLSNLFLTAILVLIVFIKPIGLLFLLFFIVFQNSYKNKLTIFYLCIFIIGLIFYIPYFITEISKPDIIIFPELEFILEKTSLNKNSFVYYILFYVTKFILLFGFDFSQSGNSFIYFFKVPAAILLLLGFLINHKNKIIFVKYFVYVYLFILVIFFYPTYRYILPIIPILILNLSFYFKNSFKKPLIKP